MGGTYYFNSAGYDVDNGANRTVTDGGRRPRIEVNIGASLPANAYISDYKVVGGSYDSFSWSGNTITISGNGYVAMRGNNPGNGPTAYWYASWGSGSWTGGMGGHVDWKYNAPSAPSAPSVSRSSNGTSLTATISGGSGQIEYRQSSINNGTNWTTVDGSSQATFSVGAHDTISVTGRNGNVDAASGSSSATVSYGIPTAPQSPSATRSTSVAGRISVGWTAPSYTGAGINYYHVYRNGSYLGQYTTSPINDDGLTRGTTYSYTVYANNSTGWSPISSTASAVAPGVPSAPGTPTVTSKVGRTLTLNSTRGSTDYGNAISEYRIQLSTDNGATWKGWDNTSKSFTATNTYNILDGSGNFTYSLLAPALTYKWRAYAVNSVGTGDLATMSVGTFVGAGGKRFDGTSWNPTTTSKRFDGTNWVDFTIAKRFNGTSWVDLT